MGDAPADEHVAESIASRASPGRAAQRNTPGSLIALTFSRSPPPPHQHLYLRVRSVLQGSARAPPAAPHRPRTSPRPPPRPRRASTPKNPRGNGRNQRHQLADAPQVKMKFSAVIVALVATSASAFQAPTKTVRGMVRPRRPASPPRATRRARSTDRFRRPSAARAPPHPRASHPRDPRRPSTPRPPRPTRARARRAPARAACSTPATRSRSRTSLTPASPSPRRPPSRSTSSPGSRRRHRRLPPPKRILARHDAQSAPARTCARWEPPSPPINRSKCSRTPPSVGVARGTMQRVGSCSASRVGFGSLAVVFTKDHHLKMRAPTGPPSS